MKSMYKITLNDVGKLVKMNPIEFFYGADLDKLNWGADGKIHDSMCYFDGYSRADCIKFFTNNLDSIYVVIAKLKLIGFKVTGIDADNCYKSLYFYTDGKPSSEYQLDLLSYTANYRGDNLIYNEYNKQDG